MRAKLIPAANATAFPKEDGEEEMAADDGPSDADPL
jgi:hypothetical protein